METIEAYIDAIKVALKETSDDSEYDDLYLYKRLNDSRLRIIDQQLTKWNKVPEGYLVEVCIPLCRDTYADCCNLPDITGTVLRSEKPIPEYIEHNFLNTFFVKNIVGYKQYPKISMQLIEERHLFPYTFEGPSWSLSHFEKDYLIMHFADTMKMIVVETIPRNPVDYHLLQSCKNGECPEWLDAKFGIPSSDAQVCIDLTLERIIKLEQPNPVDESNDSSSAVVKRE